MVEHEERKQFVSSKERDAEGHDYRHRPPTAGLPDRRGRRSEATPVSPEGRHQETLKTAST